MYPQEEIHRTHGLCSRDKSRIAGVYDGDHVGEIYGIGEILGLPTEFKCVFSIWSEVHAAFDREVHIKGRWADNRTARSISKLSDSGQCKRRDIEKPGDRLLAGRKIRVTDNIWTQRVKRANAAGVLCSDIRREMISTLVLDRID